ncbi:MAG: DUF5132 domain-containing protein [Nitrospirae bacterium]|nr:DUF5132 domain-containing protein [Nitrospirota bacterium]
MALFDNGLKGNVLTGLAIGIGASIFAPQVIPALAGVIKPIAKAAIKGSLVLYEKSKETVAEVGEMMEDIVAEVKAEMAESHEQSAGINPEDKTGA